MGDSLSVKTNACPSCGNLSLKINHTCKIKHAFRRRYVCTKCDFKITKYEIDEETYQKWKRYEYVLTKIKELVTYLRFKY